jgi:hypothetical protein
LELAAVGQPDCHAVVEGHDSGVDVGGGIPHIHRLSVAIDEHGKAGVGAECVEVVAGK